MNVSHDRIIQKMIDELQATRRGDLSEEAIVQHVANARLLADLILEDRDVGDMQASPETQLPKTNSNPNTQTDLKNTNGLKPADEPEDSIFDF
ncbi:hypothetical protein JNUCC1_01249 [Lentibacillus sp. JNUCC-1]|uniref:DUF5327 family protein n=1 Tax=Lentibacillus sp. JNUCC-1 TaxID=2654513 RepID=UPI0012E7448A|nr:DUF5327 family protein [Lentibacillus sp. JNUCC-1]MUV37443.1 hypothetical protein [Lentibacillus sp. JNUCC-1]